MFYIVAPISVEGQLRNPGGGVALQRGDHVKMLFSDKDAANANAEAMAKTKPGIQYGVFHLVTVEEAKAVRISKKVDESGQIVVVS